MEEYTMDKNFWIMLALGISIVVLLIIFIIGATIGNKNLTKFRQNLKIGDNVCALFSFQKNITITEMDDETITIEKIKIPKNYIFPKDWR